MKLLAILGDEEAQPKVRKLFMSHHAVLYSSMPVRGCSCDSYREIAGWWPSETDMSTYTSLYFAILDDAKADAIMAELEREPIATDPEFPARAFVMNVDKMI